MVRQVILNFHGLGMPGRALSDSERPYWVDPGMFHDVLNLADRLKDRAEMTFTFDDGNFSDLEIGAEALDRVRRKAIFFVMSDRIGEAGSLSAGDIAELARRGHGIGTHGAAHVDWTKLDAEGEAREYDVAREAIAAAAGRPVTDAAIPFGRYNERVIRTLKARGYVKVYSSDGGGWRPGQYPMPRTSVRSDMSLADLEAIMLGRESLKRKLRRSLSMAIKRRV